MERLSVITKSDKLVNEEITVTINSRFRTLIRLALISTPLLFSAHSCRGPPQSLATQHSRTHTVRQSTQTRSQQKAHGIGQWLCAPCQCSVVLQVADEASVCLPDAILRCRDCASSQVAFQASHWVAVEYANRLKNKSNYLLQIIQSQLSSIINRDCTLHFEICLVY